eukprot:9191246-Ditylum_brightwellii.AAC.1
MVEVVNKYLDKSLATAKGHMVQQRQNLCCTEKMTAIPPSDNDKDNNEEESFEQLEKCTHYVHVQIVYPDNNVGTGKNFTNQTGKFPWRSSRGNQYILVLYEYDGNVILVEPIKKQDSRRIVKSI